METLKSSSALVYGNRMSDLSKQLVLKAAVRDDVAWEKVQATLVGGGNELAEQQNIVDAQQEIGECNLDLVGKY